MAQAIGPVLVVDDDQDSRAFLAVILEMLGIKVLTATDGEEALAIARHHRPCLILLDVMMPGMDGFSFRETQLKTAEIAAIPVILVSAFPDQAQIQRRLGPIRVVPKPVEIDQLIAQVLTLCNPSAGGYGVRPNAC